MTNILGWFVEVAGGVAFKIYFYLAVHPWNIGALNTFSFAEVLRNSVAQPAYHLSGGHPMSRFALFTVALFVLVTVGSQSRHSGSSLKEMCVCVPARAKLMLKSAIVRAEARSAQLVASAQ
jgi:hypothetical protein